MQSDLWVCFLALCRQSTLQLTPKLELRPLACKPSLPLPVRLPEHEDWDEKFLGILACVCRVRWPTSAVLPPGTPFTDYSMVGVILPAIDGQYICAYTMHKQVLYVHISI